MRPLEGGMLSLNEKICERVVTKKVQPAQEEIKIPAQPEREVEEVTWKCPPSILSPDVEEAMSRR